MNLRTVVGDKVWRILDDLLEAEVADRYTYDVGDETRITRQNVLDLLQSYEVIDRLTFPEHVEVCRKVQSLRESWFTVPD